MDLKQFGSTTLKISPLGIGGNIFGYALNQKSANELLDYSYRHGINFIDTADVYSNGDSETIIGNYINNNRDKRNAIFRKLCSRPPLGTVESMVGKLKELL